MKIPNKIQEESNTKNPFVIPGQIVGRISGQDAF